MLTLVLKSSYNEKVDVHYSAGKCMLKGDQVFREAWSMSGYIGLTQ